ncbi:MAG: mismatch-specific DNA-glycosylase [Chloroflexota bacterium]|nr:mismatch-specific DNA-glycosylase [Chloroflexota bacterium]
MQNSDHQGAGALEQQQDFETLTDYLRPGLDIVFVGLNPSSYSVRVGHYFANPRNRFWPALNRSGLVGEELGPERDGELGNYGIGFTDVVKRPTPQASGLRAADYRQWAPALKQKLEHFRPRIACFHGMTGYKAYLKYAEGASERPELGPQERTIGCTRIYVIPNPSPANAQYSLDDLAGWYRKLAKFRDELPA